MALVRTLRTSGTASGMGTGSWTSASFTPSNNSILVIALGVVDNGGGDIAATLTAAGGGWTYTDRVTVGVSGGFNAQVRFFTAPVTTGASMTLTFDSGASNILAAAWYVWDLTGYDTSTPTGGIGSTSTTGDGPYGAISTTLNSAPTTDDFTFAMAMFDGNNSGTYSSTPGTNFSEETELSSTSNAVAAAGIYRTGQTSTTADWTDGDTGSMSLFSYAAASLVIKAGSGSSASPTLDNFTGAATGTVNNAPAVVYVKEVGFVTNTTAGTTSAITVAAGGVPVGDFLVIYGACDNTSSSPAGGATTISVADDSNNAGSANTYTLSTPQAIADPGAASAGQQGFFVTCPVTRSLDAGDTITITYGNSTTAKAINCQQFTPSITGGTGISVLSGSYTTQDNQTGQSVSVAATPDMANQVVCTLVAVEGGTADAFTEDSDTTNGSWVTLTRRGSGTTTSGSTLNSTYKLVSASGSQTYGGATMLGTSRDHCAAILVLDTPSITGTVAVTLAAATSSASGSVVGVTGTVAQTLDAFTSTATGTEVFTGTSAQTLADFTGAASGWHTISGTSAQTLAAFTTTTSGDVTNDSDGFCLVTLENATSTASGSVIFTGSSAQTLAAFTGAATGTEVFTGTSAQTLANFTGAASGTESITGTVAVTLAAFTPTASGTETISGSSAQTLAAFTSSATGSQFVGLYVTDVSANGRYLIDQNNDPILCNGLSPQIIQKLSLSAMDTLISTCQALGINAFLSVGSTIGNFGVNSSGHNVNGDPPWANAGTTNDMTSPNDNYWDHIEAFVDKCAGAGITVFLNVLDNIGWEPEINGESTADFGTFGQAMGNRFKTKPNLVWSIGVDFYFFQWGTMNAKYGAMLDGIRDAGDTHLFTLWLSADSGDGSNSTDNSDWDGTTSHSGIVWEYPDINFVYTYHSSEMEVKRAWNGQAIPAGLFESHYWDERNAVIDGISVTTRKSIRKQHGRSFTYGGQIGGFPSGDGVWEITGDYIDELGDPVFEQVAGLYSHIATLTDWHRLVPDYNQSFIATGNDAEPTIATKDADTHDYITASVSDNGTLALCYVTEGTFTVNLGELIGAPTHYWYDPTSGDVTSPVTGQPTYPGNNSAGDEDWLLVFQGNENATGTVAVTLANHTANGSGAVVFTGTSAQTLANFTGAATGTETITGTVAQTLAGVTSSAAGTSSIFFFGWNQIGSTSYATASNWLCEAVTHSTQRYTAVAGDAVTRLEVHGAGTGTAQLGIYTFSGGVPVTRIGTATVTIGSGAAWYGADTSIGLIAGTNYCVAIDYFLTGSESWDVSIEDFLGLGNSTSLDTGTGDPLPATWTEDSTTSSAVSIRAQVTSGLITGTVAVTLANVTSSASGTETITGTSAQTLANFTSTASGSVVITGTSAQTLANFTSSATGTEAITGTSAQTLAAFTSTASGTETITGTSAQTLANFTGAASGSITNPGSNGASVLADFTSSASGSVGDVGTVAVTLANFTSAASGTQTITGTVAVTLANATSTASGTVAFGGSAAVTLANAVAAASGSVGLSGSSAQTLADFTSVAFGSSLVTVTGTVAVTLANFTCFAFEQSVGLSPFTKVETIYVDFDPEETIYVEL